MTSHHQHKRSDRQPLRVYRVSRLEPIAAASSTCPACGTATPSTRAEDAYLVTPEAAGVPVPSFIETLRQIATRFSTTSEGRPPHAHSSWWNPQQGNRRQHPRDDGAVVFLARGDANRASNTDDLVMVDTGHDQHVFRIPTMPTST